MSLEPVVVEMFCKACGASVSLGMWLDEHELAHPRLDADVVKDSSLYKGQYSKEQYWRALAYLQPRHKQMCALLGGLHTRCM